MECTRCLSTLAALLATLVYSHAWFQDGEDSRKAAVEHGKLTMLALAMGAQHSLGENTAASRPRLARLEGDIAFTTLLKRMLNLRLGIPRESVTWNFSINSRSLTALPVTF